MDQGKGSKSGIFYSLKQRFWKSNLTNKSCFKSRGSKHKVRSESSHCNFVSCNTETRCNENCDTLRSPELNNISSVSEPAITACIGSSQVTTQTSSSAGCLDEDFNVNSVGNIILPLRNTEDSSSLPDSVFITEASNVPSAASDSLVGESSSEVQTATVVNGDLHKSIPSDTNMKSGLMTELLKLSKYGWYWGSISKEEAEEKLTGQPDGAFLLRDSSADHFILSLSFRSSGKTLHSRIEYSLGRGQFSFYQQPEESFSSIAELVEHSMSFSKSAVYCYSRPVSPGHPAFPVRLTKPVSRFAHVRSLQHLCRFVIRESIRLDNIQKLPLPNKLKGYIEEGYY